MFRLPVPENVVPDGRSKDKPLHLEGIEKRDFKQLLKVMYPKSVYAPGVKRPSADTTDWDVEISDERSH
jgi:hypothetical protein